MKTHPWHPVDFVDFVDIFRKPSICADLRALWLVDISWIFRGFRGFRGYFVDFAGERPGVRISFCAHETTHPRHPGDIGDIGDISRKPLKFQYFLNVHGGDISGDIFGDGDIGDIFWNEDFHAQDTSECACCTGRFDGIDESSQNCHSEAHSMGRTPGDPGKRLARVLRARYQCVCVLHRSIRCGEPLLPRLRTHAEFGLVGPPSW